MSGDDVPPPDPGLDRDIDTVVAAIGGHRRDGQHAMAQAVARTLAGGPHLLVQAGTGTGKSLAYLVPAIRHHGRVVVATATLALQHQLVSRDLPTVVDALATAGGRPTFAVLKGRQNYVCLERLRRGAADSDDDALFSPAPTTPLGRQAARLREWAEQTGSGDRDELTEPVDPRVWRAVSVSSRECVGAAKCPFGEECFAEAARARAAEADVVVTNHALLAIAAMEGIPVLPPHDAVVVDEAHELADRATATATVELSAPMVERAASRARRLLDDDVMDLLDDAAALLADALAEAVSGSTGPRRLESVSGGLVSALTAVRDGGHAAITAFAAMRDRDDPDAVATRSRARAAIEEVHDVAGRLLTLGEHDVAWLDPGDRRSPALKLAPLSVSGLLRASLFDQTPVVLTSATLTLGGSFDAIASSLGLTEPGSYVGLDVGSPFDHAAQGILYLPRRLPRPGRDGVAEEALDELASLVVAAGGRTLALFSSWRGVERAAEHLRIWLDTRPAEGPPAAGGAGTSPAGAPGPTVQGVGSPPRPEIPLLVQRKGDPVAGLVRRFAAEPRSVLLGTLSLWQGVDVPGAACTLVVIDRIPFPRPDDPLLAARQARVDRAGGSGFMAVAVPRAALLLAQGVGRLIRGPDDRGVVAVLDPRLATARYGSYLRDSLPRFWTTSDGDVVRAALARLDAASS